MTERDHGFVLPNRTPLSEQEWQWMETMRSIVGGHLPWMTLEQAQELQQLFRRRVD
ncbi:hypothetical protein [Salipiger sp. IMCC34102]|uniref:hypothetical protein n=1 Tax=Salipiger sp. IMCC34102 TaxID=2510647 RepID=UPI0013EE1528|nr:hypothetical protein [Salipiger sp. IMCC34102]